MEIEFKLIDGLGTNVVIGQKCTIGNRIKYTAICIVRSKFVFLYPNDIGIFLGHQILKKAGHDFYVEIAAFPRVGKVSASIGVFEPVRNACLTYK